MGRITVALLAISCLFFVSCEKMDSDYLAGTTWTSDRTGTEDQWYQDELTFTATTFSYIRKTDYGTTGGSTTGTYTFDPPTVTLQVPPIAERGETYVQPTYGAVKGRTMNVEILTGDLLWTLKLKKQ